MFSRIVSGHNHSQSTANDCRGIHPYSATHPKRRVNKTDYCITSMHSSWWPAVALPGGGGWDYSPPIDQQATMQNIENTTFLALLRLIFALE